MRKPIELHKGQDTFDCTPLHGRIAELETQLADQIKEYLILGEESNKLLVKIEAMKDFLELVSHWKDAYPESVFTPMTTEEYHNLCSRSNYSVDRVSAHVLRASVKGYSESAIKLLKQIKEQSK
jgi:hypothetical protein